ncbi:MAG: hypothetical protein JO021_06860 [Alphaproteobacteria bacterium]|nr:hypothetical protein [Alphaproteobacteria bacterium]
MKSLGVALCVVALAGCSPRDEPLGGASGSPGAFVVRGQAVIAHPPGDRDANEQARREAAARCPDGFVMRSFKTRPPSTLTFVDHVIDYEAVVTCAGPGAR